MVHYWDLLSNFLFPLGNDDLTCIEKKSYIGFPQYFSLFTSQMAALFSFPDLKYM